MTFLLVFIAVMFIISALVWVLAMGARLIDRQVEQWPLLWATALWLCVCVPALGLIISLIPSAAAHDALSVFSLHEPLQSIGLMTGGQVEPVAETHVWSFAWVKSGLIALYLGGVALTVSKLAWGRYRIHRLILAADCADIAGQDDVLVSNFVQSPFAWTPFGQPTHSRILLPQSYRGAVSSEQIHDILIHERAHIARRDDECGLVMRILLCLCWMSPFAYRLFEHWSQATEIRCDMAVTAHRDPQMRKAYADTLLRALHIAAGRVQQYPAASFSTQRIRNEKMRIKHIMDGSQPAFKRLRDRLVLGGVAGAIALTGTLAISTTAMADPAPTSKTVNTVVNPIVSGVVTSKFGPASDPFNKGKTRNHHGLDIKAPTGTPIYAPADGVIRAATELYDGKPAYGTVVIIETEGWTKTMFAHLDAATVEEGQWVAKGTQIATVGNTGKSTGPHVHIETHVNGKRIDPATVWDLLPNN